MASSVKHPHRRHCTGVLEQVKKDPQTSPNETTCSSAPKSMIIRSKFPPDSTTCCTPTWPTRVGSPGILLQVRQGRRQKPRRFLSHPVQIDTFSSNVLIHQMHFSFRRWQPGLRWPTTALGCCCCGLCHLHRCVNFVWELVLSSMVMILLRSQSLCTFAKKKKCAAPAVKAMLV